MRMTGMTSSRIGERGASGVDAGLAVTALLLMLMLVAGGLRVSGTNGDVAAAARAGARAASQAYNAAEGEAAARSVVDRALADRGVACENVTTSVLGDWSPGGIVRVEVSCVIDLSDAVLVGLPGTRQTTGVGIEVVDTLRGASR